MPLVITFNQTFGPDPTYIPFQPIHAYKVSFITAAHLPLYFLMPGFKIFCNTRYYNLPRSPPTYNIDKSENKSPKGLTHKVSSYLYLHQNFGGTVASIV